jgi:predicted short-subunit dehydrogenase-like oxidoreductase (DUF2520 family)
LQQLAGRITGRVIEANSSQRLYMHLAAVFASNFSNHMYALSELLMKEQNIPFDLLSPLIQETAAKVLHISPLHAQTGPAIRGNQQVMEKHMTILENHPEMKELYKQISDHIALLRR